jgi:uncharacterized protein
VVTIEKLSMVDRGESALKRLGFRQVRVRHHGEAAKIEVGTDELSRALDPEMADRIILAIKELGFREVAIDSAGYRTGSLNEALREVELKAYPLDLPKK